VFLKNCAGCHGADAAGAIGFPNLADADWLYGGAPDAIVTSITAGRHGQMPAFLAAMDEATGDALVETVRRWNDPQLDERVRARGMKQFSITCAACHGPEAKGNAAIGAPNLTDATWLYGGSREQVRHSILFGRESNMPSHQQILTPAEIRVVSAYVYQLSGSAP
jgi:cytochrome c oxidase cbb3-type subunit 3